MRSRATAFAVIRPAEVHCYKVILVENVVEFATRWERFDWWIARLPTGLYSQIMIYGAHSGGRKERDRLVVAAARAGRSYR